MGTGTGKSTCGLPAMFTSSWTQLGLFGGHILTKDSKIRHHPGRSLLADSHTEGGVRTQGNIFVLTADPPSPFTHSFQKSIEQGNGRRERSLDWIRAGFGKGHKAASGKPPLNAGLIRAV
jgi:hypothetical protein